MSDGFFKLKLSVISQTLLSYKESICGTNFELYCTKLGKEPRVHVNDNYGTWVRLFNMYT